MRVFINAASVKEGGSRVFLEKLLFAMREARPDIQWIIATHPRIIPSACSADSTLWIPTPDIERSALRVFNWYEFTLPTLVRRHRADILFSQTNYLPWRPMRCPTMLLIQHAGHFSKEFDQLMSTHLDSMFARILWRQKSRWVRRSAIVANLLMVQTEAMAEAISVQTGRKRSGINVISPGPGLAVRYAGPRSFKDQASFRIGYVTKFGVQKNFQTLFAAAQKLRDAGYRFKLVLTLTHDASETRDLLAKAQAMGLDSQIENRGEVAEEGISAVYDSLDIFVFPSVCESFGFPLVEAMARGLPVIAAGTQSNIEVTGGSALQFEKYDATGLAGVLAKVMDDRDTRTRQAKLSVSAGSRFSWEKAAVDTIAALESLGSFKHSLK